MLLHGLGTVAPAPDKSGQLSCSGELCGVRVIPAVDVAVVQVKAAHRVGCSYAVTRRDWRAMVVFGINDDVFAVINTAKARTPSDMFQKQGVVSPAIVASAVRWLMIYASGKPMGRATYSNQELWAFFEKLDRILLDKVVEEAHATSKVFPRGALAAHLYLFEQKHAATKKKFIDDASHNRRGAGKLAKILFQQRKDNMGRVNDVWVNALLVLAWNAYRKGEQPTARILKWNAAEKEYPEIA